MSNFPLQTLQFENHNIDCIEIEGKKYISSLNMANALEYSSSKSVTNLFNTNKAEFIEGEDYTVIDMMTVKNAPYKQIFFSMEGVMGITMLAKTEKAAAFRQWARKTLANLPAVQQAPQIDGKFLLEIAQQMIEKENLIKLQSTKIEVLEIENTQKEEVIEKHIEAKEHKNYTQTADIVGMPQQKFLKYLRANGYVEKAGRRPTVKSKNLKIIETKWSDKGYERFLVTPKGIKYFKRKISLKK
jgi:prophage antirepressor-like protein